MPCSRTGMIRLPSAPAAEADRSVTMQDVIARRTLDPDGGTSPSVCCPFHLGTERTLRIDTAAQLFRCSVCGAEGDAVLLPVRK